MQIDARTGASSASAKKPANPDPMPDDPDALPGLDGHLRLQCDIFCSTSCAATPPTTTARTTSARTSFRRSSIRTSCGRFRSATRTPGNGCYWRDVGTLDAYYEANMDLIAVEPELNLYDTSGRSARISAAISAAEICVRAIEDRDSPAWAQRSTAWSATDRSSPAAASSGRIISPDVRVNSWAQVEDSILFEGVNIGRHAKVRRAIIDKGVSIPEGDGNRLRPRRGPHARLHRHRIGIVVIGKVDGLSEIDRLRPHVNACPARRSSIERLFGRYLFQASHGRKPVGLARLPMSFTRWDNPEAYASGSP